MNNVSFLTWTQPSAPGQATGDLCWISQFTRGPSPCGWTEWVGTLSAGSRDFVILGPENRTHTKIFESRSKRCERQNWTWGTSKKKKKKVPSLLPPSLFNLGGKWREAVLSFGWINFTLLSHSFWGWLFSLLPFLDPFWGARTSALARAVWYSSLLKPGSPIDQL